MTRSVILIQVALLFNANTSTRPLWVGRASSSGRVRLEYEMKRIMYTFNRKRRKKLMSQLEKHNREIQTLLGKSERLEPIRKKRKSPVTK